MGLPKAHQLRKRKLPRTQSVNLQSRQRTKTRDSLEDDLILLGATAAWSLPTSGSEASSFPSSSDSGSSSSPIESGGGGDFGGGGSGGDW